MENLDAIEKDYFKLLAEAHSDELRAALWRNLQRYRKYEKENPHMIAACEGFGENE
jgi:hypothetical protein